MDHRSIRGWRRRGTMERARPERAAAAGRFGFGWRTLARLGPFGSPRMAALDAATSPGFRAANRTRTLAAVALHAVGKRLGGLEARQLYHRLAARPHRKQRALGRTETA